MVPPALIKSLVCQMLLMKRGASLQVHAPSSIVSNSSVVDGKYVCVVASVEDKLLEVIPRPQIERVAASPRSEVRIVWVELFVHGDVAENTHVLPREDVRNIEDGKAVQHHHGGQDGI